MRPRAVSSSSSSSSSGDEDEGDEDGMPVDGVGAARGDGFARRVAANVEFAHGVVASGERGVKGGVEIDLVSRERWVNACERMVETRG